MDTWVNGEHVSSWPPFDLPDKENLRELALWDRLHNCVITRDGEAIPFDCAEQFIKEVTERRLLVFCFRLMDKREFSPLDELLQDKRVKAYATRTGSITGIYIKSKKSAWIVERRIWDDVVTPPDMAFLDVMERVFEINGRCAATPGALGEKKIRETIAPGTRFSRPSHMLRRRLLDNKIGGRADTLEEKRHYGVLYEEDGNGWYSFCACETIDPGETPTGFGGGRHPVNDILLSTFYSYYGLAHITLPLNAKPVKFGPLAVRVRGQLRWPTTRGTTFSGWYWKEELDRARAAGYEVTVVQGYGWYRSSHWLEQWARHMWELRLAAKGDKAVELIIKRETNAAIGRLGMAPETVIVVDEAHYQDGDEPIPVKHAAYEQSPVSNYYIHCTFNLDSDRLNHIASHIVMRGRILLYDLILAEELSGNKVVASNYDSVYTTQPSALRHLIGTELGMVKQHTIVDAYIHAPRWIKGLRDGVPIDKRPGSERTTRKELSAHNIYYEHNDDQSRDTKYNNRKKQRQRPVHVSSP